MLLALLLAVLPGWQREATAPTSDPIFSAHKLHADVDFLCSSTLEGRKTASWGEHAAAQWLIARFQQCGLQPLPHGWLQSFSSRPRQLSSANCQLQFGKQNFSLGTSFLPHPNSPPGFAQGPLVFAGFGLPQDPTDTRIFQNAIVLILRYAPASESGVELPQEAILAAKVQRLQELGAAAVCVVEPPFFAADPRLQLANGRFFWPSLSPLPQIAQSRLHTPEVQAKLQQQNFSWQDAEDFLFFQAQAEAPLGASIPVIYGNASVLQAAFANSPWSWQDCWRQLQYPATKLSPFSLRTTASLRIQLEPQAQSQSWNVIGYLPGTDPRQRQRTIVIGAHYDHLGANAAGQVWPGANDNASGVAGLLALAQFFAQPEHRPQRSLCFVAFGGEEHGLSGSLAFCRHPPLNPSHMDAMLNLEGIGLGGNQELWVLGSSSQAEFAKLLQVQASVLGLRLHRDEEANFDASDHVLFYRLGIPVLAFHTQADSAYHSPQDLPQRLHYRGMARILTFVAGILSEVANLPGPRTFQDYRSHFQAAWGAPLPLPFPWELPFHQRIDY